MNSVRILCLLAFISLVSCTPIPHYETLSGKLAGRVVDGTGKPVPGATVEFLHRSHPVLGKTRTDQAGAFRFGPFRQWFYVLYIGSPGVWPFPHTLRNLGLPHVLRVRHEENTALYVLGTPAQFAAQNSQLPKSLQARVSRQARWTGEVPTKLNLVITPDMHDEQPPVQKPHLCPTS